MGAVVLKVEPPQRRRDAGRVQRDELRARCAWLLAVDVAERAIDGVGFARIYCTPGKVGRGSDNRTALARKIACYLATTVGNCESQLVARAAGLHRATVIGHCNAVEDMRDDPAINNSLDDMGRAMVTAAASMVMANLGDAA